MNKKKLILPKDLKELEALLNEWSQKRQKLELEAVTGKLKKISDLADARRKIAQILTKINEQKNIKE
ncbi:50S ribosomal protein L29 [Candidatus Collierbacteria bacterium]|nr:50S ribosomal protein L29 [Candidatus Collierbacteria bacterium]